MAFEKDWIFKRMSNTGETPSELGSRGGNKAAKIAREKKAKEMADKYIKNKYDKFPKCSKCGGFLAMGRCSVCDD
jgi:recombinational DNA repair protein RecR